MNDALPMRYNIASIQAQQTLGGGIMQVNENGDWVEFNAYKRLLDEYKALKEENNEHKSRFERLSKTNPESVFDVDVINDPAWTVAIFRHHRETERRIIAKQEAEIDKLKDRIATLSSQCVYWEKQSKQEAEWLPIESAPKDASNILVFCRTKVMIACWNGFNWMESSTRDEIEPVKWAKMVAKPSD